MRVNLVTGELVKSVDPSANDNYAIRWSARNGNTLVVKVILKDLRVDPSNNDNYAIK